MALSITGKLMGKAAQLQHIDDLNASLERSPFTKKFEKAYTSLIDAMGDDFFVWYDSPKFNGLTNAQMLIVMQGKLASFVTDEDAASLHNMIVTAESTEAEIASTILTDSEDDELTDTGLNDDRPYRPASLNIDDIPF